MTCPMLHEPLDMFVGRAVFDIALLLRASPYHDRVGILRFAAMSRLAM